MVEGERERDRETEGEILSARLIVIVMKLGEATERAYEYTPAGDEFERTTARDREREGIRSLSL